MPKLEKFSLDIRVRDINLSRGIITREDIEKHIKSLSDDANNGEELVVYEEEIDSADAVSEDSPASAKQPS